jgi:hypothetical protein
VYQLAGLFFLAVLPYNRQDATRVWAMSYPTIYDVSYSYTGFQAALGDGSFPGTQLDADMAGLSDSIASIEAFIQTAFRSDGVLKAASLPGTDPILQYVDEAAAAAAASATEIATTAATSASASATAAAGSATNAATSETQAASSASAAQTARTGAETAQTAAVAAKTAAETAQTGAQTAETVAVTAKTAAETAQTGAQTARTGAETAQTAAEAAKTATEAFFTSGSFSTTHLVHAVSATTRFPASSRYIASNNGYGFLADVYGGYGGLFGRRTGGTNASPTALTGTNTLVAYEGAGWHSGGAFGTHVVGVYLVGAGDFTSTSQPTRIDFDVTPTGSITQATALRIQPSGLIDVLSGKIGFPATQIPSTDPNVLDDYEEGSFTPVLVGSGNTFSFLTQAGRYTKIGRMVNFELTIELNTSGNTLAANALTITGLPFTSGTTNAVFPVAWHNSTSLFVHVSAALSSGSTTLTLYGLTAAATSSYSAATGLTLMHATNGSRLRINGTYEASA